MNYITKCTVAGLMVGFYITVAANLKVTEVYGGCLLALGTVKVVEWITEGDSRK